MAWNAVTPRSTREAVALDRGDQRARRSGRPRRRSRASRIAGTSSQAALTHDGPRQQRKQVESRAEARLLAARRTGSRPAQVAARVEQMLLDEPRGDVLRQRGSASGASETKSRPERRSSRPARSQKRPASLVAAALEQRALDALGARERPRRSSPEQARQRAQRERVEDVDEHVLDVLVVARDDRARVVAEAARALDEPEVARPVVAHPAEDAVVLRRVVEPRLVGVDDRDQAVAVGIALRGRATR